MPFVSPYNNAKVMLLNDRGPLPFIMLDKLVYESPLTGQEYEVKVNFRTDLASVPKAVVALPVVGPALFFRFFGNGVWKGAREAILHDYLRRPDKAGRLPVPAYLAHRVFREALIDTGYPDDLVSAYYAAVKLFNS